jgi:uncharacterized membrane protein YeaQ/YmgE (transglycosylase-associated protein family)
MDLMLWVLVGVIAGWLAGKSLEGNGYGRSMDHVLGAGGAVPVGGSFGARAFPVMAELPSRHSWALAVPRFL